MSTIDLATSRKLVEGKYKSDGYVAIVIYANMFGGISFKACKKDQAPMFMKQFTQNGWDNELVWERTDNSQFNQAEMNKFESDVKSFAAQHPNYSMS